MPAGRPPTRTLTALIGGHVTVLVGAVVVAGLLMFDRRTEAVGAGGAVLGTGLLVASLGAVAVGQVLSVRRLTAHSRAATARCLDEPALAAGVRRIGWSVVLACYPLILGTLPLVLDPPPLALLAALVSVVAAALLLDLEHASWAYRRLPYKAGARLLPPGSRSRIHSGQNVTVALYVGLAVAGTALFAASVLAEIDRASPAPPASVVQITAAAGPVLVPLLLVRPVRRVAAAVTTTDRGDVVHLDALDLAARPFIRLRGLCVLAAALGAAALLAEPAAPALAAVRTVPLLLVLGSAALQIGSLTSINLADTARRPRR